jgi:hypothetical protein
MADATRRSTHIAQRMILHGWRISDSEIWIPRKYPGGVSGGNGYHMPGTSTRALRKLQGAQFGPSAMEVEGVGIPAPARSSI